jgi:NTE family protein
MSPEPPKIGLALGGGGAKGLAHVAALEAFDDLGLRPHAIAGASIGAILGAGYGAGFSARAIRQHLLRSFRDRPEVMAKLFRTRVGRVQDLFSGGLGNPLLVDAEKILDEFWLPSMPERFEDLRLPVLVVATDFYGRCEVVFRSGPLKAAVAASMAVPGLLRPVKIGERMFIDGVVINPVPFDRLPADCDAIIAVDVVGGPEGAVTASFPTAMDITLGASQIMQSAIFEGKMALAGGAVHVVRPDVARFGALDFFQVKKVLQASEPVRDQVRGLIEAAIKAAEITPSRPAFFPASGTDRG